MSLTQATVYSVAERPDLQHEIQLLDAIAFPTFMAHSDLSPLWPLVYAEFPEYQLVLRDGASDQHLAHSNGVPLAWDGSYTGLPKSAAEMVELAVHQKRRGLRPTAVGALQAVVHPAHQMGGKSSLMLQAMATQASAVGMRALFAPIRPTHKTLYPLARIESYVGWVRRDGQAVDPWQRVHVRLGATPAGIVPRWLTVTATPSDWTTWTGLVFPDTGRYVVPGALVPLDIDLERNVGTYVEPHLWMHYRLVAEGARSSEIRAA
jgi:hypothetical protein